MSNLYNLEPQPTAKVVLNTSSGDLTIELFAKQTPLASRNFLQHCLDGYYKNTIFHRLVPGFIIQGGDPTGSGSGGISTINDGDQFQDEFHSRLKFNRRGLLGMANEGPNSNGSQFFFTLNATPELQGKNTMFGRVEGDTIYNLMKMADAEMTEDGSERPLYPTKITGAEILVNPFDDMVARVLEAPRSKRDDGKKAINKRKKPAGRNVLSFGMDEGEEDVVPVLKKAKANPKLVAVSEEPTEPAKTTGTKETRAKKGSSHMEESISRDEPAAAATAWPSPPSNKGNAVEPEEAHESAESETEDDRRQQALDETNAEIERLKASLKRTVDSKPREREKPKSALEALIPASSMRGRKRGKVADEKGALDMFKAFKGRLQDLPEDRAPASTTAPRTGVSANGHEPEAGVKNSPEEEAELCDLHFIANCQSCKAWDEENVDADGQGDEDDDAGWMTHKLSFAKDSLGKDLEWKKKMEVIEVIDPREKARAIREDGRKAKKSQSQR